MKRAIRRFHKERMKLKAEKLYPNYSKARNLADNLTCCSSYCCGNPRKWFKTKTRQEKLADIYLKEERRNHGF